jgi:hypothetical protein
MRVMNRPGRDRKPAAANRVSDDNGFVEIATLSLAGLTVALFQIAHYIGTDALRQMFAQ